MRTVETSHPPSWYLPPGDLKPGLLRRSERRSFCEWKGHAVYWHLAIGDAQLPDVAWSYPQSTDAFAILRDHVAFYAGSLDRCLVDGEQVVPQPGGFYGGWIGVSMTSPSIRFVPFRPKIGPSNRPIEHPTPMPALVTRSLDGPEQPAVPVVRFGPSIAVWRDPPNS